MCRSAFGQFFSLLLVIVPEFFANLESTQFPFHNLNPFAPRDFSEKHVLKLTSGFLVTFVL